MFLAFHRPISHSLKSITKWVRSPLFINIERGRFGYLPRDILHHSNYGRGLFDGQIFIRDLRSIRFAQTVVGMLKSRTDEALGQFNRKMSPLGNEFEPK